MRYGIDIDGVIADFDTACAQVMRQAPEPISNEALALLDQPAQHWYHKRDLVGAENWSWFWQWAVPNLRPFATAPAFRAEPLWLEQLKGEKFLITSRPAEAHDQTYYWLGRNRVHVNGVLHVARAEEKVEFIRCLGLDVYVDDHPETVANLMGEVDAKLYLFDQPWNQEVVGPDRIRSLRELL